MLLTDLLSKLLQAKANASKKAQTSLHANFFKFVCFIFKMDLSLFPFCGPFMFVLLVNNKNFFQNFE